MKQKLITVAAVLLIASTQLTNAQKDTLRRITTDSVIVHQRKQNPLLVFRAIKTEYVYQIGKLWYNQRGQTIGRVRFYKRDGAWIELK